MSLQFQNDVCIFYLGAGLKVEAVADLAAGSAVCLAVEAVAGSIAVIVVEY